MTKHTGIPQELLDSLDFSGKPPALTLDEWGALVRLLKIARGDTGGARRVANFLLAWWNAASCGGFDLTDLWYLDREIVDDVLRVMGFIGRRQMYPDLLECEEGGAVSFKDEFEALVRDWRPDLAK